MALWTKLKHSAQQWGEKINKTAVSLQASASTIFFELQTLVTLT